MQPHGIEQSGISWLQVIGLVLGIVLPTTTFVIGLATAYLRLFIRNELFDQKEAIFKHIDTEFALKELVGEKLKLVDTKFEEIERRLQKAESKLEL